MKQVLPLLMLLISWNIGTAQEVHQFTLEGAIQHALEHNPNIKKATLDEEIAKELKQEAIGGYLPQIKATAQYIDNFALPVQLLPAEFGLLLGMESNAPIPVTFGVQHGVNAGVQVNQLIFNQQIVAAIKSSGELNKLYELGTRSAQEGLVYQVTQTYLQLQVSQKQRKIIEGNLDKLKRLYNISKVQEENGLAKPNEVKRLFISLSNTENMLLEVNYAIDQLYNLMKLHLNIEMTDSLDLVDDLTTYQYYSLTPELKLENNSQIQLLKQQKTISEANQELQKAAFFPTLAAFFNYSYQGQNNEFKFSGDGYNSFESGYWGLSLQVPLFTGFQNRNRLQKARLETKKIMEDLSLLEKSVQMGFENSLNRIQLSHKQLKTQNESMNVAQDIYDAAILGYEEGLTPLVELLDKETELKLAQNNYLSALLNLKLAELEQLKINGQLSDFIQKN
ncbi:TolC family protein [Xanthovirga aplysinae]|uniref:TolC family protein n=1 Tax=Xanthovirga aplysinae TaxID=2529853 RepID=UPI0012BBB1F6|nr:TolC family protein [Xanthovirga aplysinae]MTI32724.1 TolC family protein [Xanthovirga aplysinae]